MHAPPALPPTARFVREAGYDGCVELTHGATRVVLEPNVGGRVIRYAISGVEAMHREPSQEGVVWDGMPGLRHPCGGRFDVGPEYDPIPHEEIWLGRWTAEITGPCAARLTSAITREAGLQLVRDFTLGEGSRLRCVQTIRNRGPAPLRVFHWSRTFLPAGGIALAPLPRAGRFPRGYALCEPAGVIDFLPHPEPMLRIVDRVLQVTGYPERPKLVLDVDPGWLGYLGADGLLFVKTFPVYPKARYGELSANNASIWYGGAENHPGWPFRQGVAEIEAIGPEEILRPDDACEFAEDWFLALASVPATLPAERLQWAVAAARGFAGEPAGADLGQRSPAASR